SRSGTARPFPLWRLLSSPHSPPIDPITREWYCPQARIAGLLTFRALTGSAHPAALISIAQECGAFATHRALSRLSISTICTCIRVSARPLRRFLPQLFGHLRPEIGNAARRCRFVRGGRARLGTGGALAHIGVRSICAGIAALALGFALESVGR